MTVAVDLGSDAVKVAAGDGSPVLLEHPIDPELAARVGTTVPLIRRNGSLVIMQTPHDAYVRAVATALDGKAAESVAVVAPDWWSKRAREVVEQTLKAHASGPFQLVSPAVAAIGASGENHRLPTTVAVLDIGAESSSATVVSAADGVLRVVGHPAVLHGRAGNDIDRRLMQHVLGWLRTGGGYETDATLAEAGESLLTQVKAAKERLSTRPAATVKPDIAGSHELRLVRSEFDEVARETVDAIVAMLKACIETNAEEAEAVLLTGGSVSIPLVTQVISVQVGLPVVLDNDPATLAVRGAATTEMPAAPKRRRWRLRHRRAGSAGHVFDLDDAPTPDSQPLPDSLPNPPPGPSPKHRVEATAADESDETAPESEVREAPAGNGTAPRLGGFIERSRREGEAARPELGPVHLVVEKGDSPSSGRTVRWTSSPEDTGWDSARHGHVDGEGQFRIRVNDRDYDVDMGTELASTPVTVLLVGLHVFVTASGSGAVLRELRLNPDDDYRPE
jgi:actin-like ATPase involved in cell morphogenesis